MMDSNYHLFKVLKLFNKNIKYMDAELEYKAECLLYEEAMKHCNVDMERFLEAALAGMWNMQLVADLDDVVRSLNNEWEEPEKDPWLGCTDKEKKLEILRIEHKLLEMALDNIYYHKADMVERGEEDKYQVW